MGCLLMRYQRCRMLQSATPYCGRACAGACHMYAACSCTSSHTSNAAPPLHPVTTPSRRTRPSDHSAGSGGSRRYRAHQTQGVAVPRPLRPSGSRSSTLFGEPCRGVPVVRCGTPTCGVWYRLTSVSEEEDASSWSWKALNWTRHTQWEWPPSSNTASDFPLILHRARARAKATQRAVRGRQREMSDHRRPCCCHP